MRIYLVRHARQCSPLCNVNVELAPEGVQQAELLAARFQGNFELIQMEKMDVSSSLIREKLIKGEEVRGMLPKKVYEYIMENGCYGLDKE